MDMLPTASFGLTNNPDDWGQSFATPHKTLVATRLEEVRPLIAAAIVAAECGSYVALMLTYEAAPAFDPALVTHEAESFPFAWAAFFDAPVQAPSKFDTYSVEGWQPQIPLSEYRRSIATIHEHIAAGNTYQVNYSFPFTTSFAGDSFAWYRDLCEAQGAPFSAFLNLGRYQILSLSPELFFQREGNSVRTRPMKGTVRRGRYHSEDVLLANWLRRSIKDQAENVMIVDLLRNDLGKVSRPGTVCVTKLFELEKFETVWQMTSTVEATLKSNVRLADLMQALFPCGSVTGAPKISTMKLIRELERFPRGPYTGAIGLIQPGGDCTFNVAIRTVVLDSYTGIATFGVGGGITFDSIADREYEECITKARFLMNSGPRFDLFESILLEHGDFFLKERHIERMHNSASFFGFQFPIGDIVDELQQAATSHPSGTWKIRLILSRSGTVRLSVEPITATDNKYNRVILATTPIDSSNRLLFHKTTNREFYAAQAGTHADFDDVVFWNERGEVTESSVANVVVKLDDKLYTPPISSGLLAGTFRDEMIAKGMISERVITVEQLKSAQEFFLINSVRRWMTATLNNAAVAQTF